MFKFFSHVTLLGLASMPNYSLLANSVETSYQSDRPYIIGGLYTHRTLLGGLGNQMFEVATTCALAWDHGADPYFPDFERLVPYPETSYHHFFFRCKISPPSQEISQEWTSPCYGYYPIPFQPKMKLMGYFQNELYFAHQRKRILELFAPSQEDLNYLQSKYDWIINHPNTVSIHLRYYYGEVSHLDYYIQYDWEYYERAMALFPDSSLFVVTTDNMAFARQNIPTKGKNVTFIEGEPPYIDFFLQSMCKNNIISNSTFSWWSAWLNQNPDKIVIRPKVWLTGFPDIGGPDEWIKIDAEGLQARLKRK